MNPIYLWWDDENVARQSLPDNSEIGRHMRLRAQWQAAVEYVRRIRFI